MLSPVDEDPSLEPSGPQLVPSGAGADEAVGQLQGPVAAAHDWPSIVLVDRGECRKPNHETMDGIADGACCVRVGDAVPAF